MSALELKAPLAFLSLSRAWRSQGLPSSLLMGDKKPGNKKSKIKFLKHTEKAVSVQMFSWEGSEGSSELKGKLTCDAAPRDPGGVLKLRGLFRDVQS